MPRRWLPPSAAPARHARRTARGRRESGPRAAVSSTRAAERSSIRSTSAGWQELGWPRVLAAVRAAQPSTGLTAKHSRPWCERRAVHAGRGERACQAGARHNVTNSVMAAASGPGTCLARDGRMLPLPRLRNRRQASTRLAVRAADSCDEGKLPATKSYDGAHRRRIGDHRSRRRKRNALSWMGSASSSPSAVPTQVARRVRLEVAARDAESRRNASERDR